MGAGKGFPATKGTLTAGANLSAKQFRVVKFSSGKVVAAAAATDLVVGVLQNKPAADGRPAEVVTAGESKVVAAGSISAGQFLVANSDGDVVAVTLGTTTTNVAIGRALEDAADNDVFRMLVAPQFIQV